VGDGIGCYRRRRPWLPLLLLCLLGAFCSTQARQPPRHPRPVEVEPPDAAKHIQHLPAYVQPRKDLHKGVLSALLLRLVSLLTWDMRQQLSTYFHPGNPPVPPAMPGATHSKPGSSAVPPQPPALDLPGPTRPNMDATRVVT
jgi:hypothetical protein